MKKSLLILFILLAFVSIAKAQKPVIDTMNLATKTSQPQQAEQIFTAVENEPSFPGGMQQLEKYFKKNNKQYTKGEGDGITVVTFVVEKDGSLSGIKILRNSSDVSESDIMQLMINCPKWNAGTQRGQPVRVQYTIPLHFYNN